jgi:hypothetical protein
MPDAASSILTCSLRKRLAALIHQPKIETTMITKMTAMTMMAIAQPGTEHYLLKSCFFSFNADSPRGHYTRKFPLRKKNFTIPRMGLPQENAILLLLCKIGFDEIQQIVNITIERRLKNFEIKMGVIMDQDVPKSFHVAKGKVGMRKKEFFAHSSSNFAKLFKIKSDGASHQTSVRELFVIFYGKAVFLDSFQEVAHFF